MLTTFLFSWVCVLSSCSQQVHQGASSEGKDRGLYRVTVYWLAQEEKKAPTGSKFTNKTRGSVVVVTDRKKGAILWPEDHKKLRVSWDFAQQLRIQGSGILRGGQLVQYLGPCDKPDANRVCFRVRYLDQRRYPLSVGAAGTRLEAFRSVAVDSRHIPLGSSMYIPTLGRILREKGYAHDGCFVAQDRGGRIVGARIDLFVGWPRWFYTRLGKRLPQYVRLYTKHPSCRGKK